MVMKWRALWHMLFFLIVRRKERSHTYLQFHALQLPPLPSRDYLLITHSEAPQIQGIQTHERCICTWKFCLEMTCTAQTRFCRWLATISKPNVRCPPHVRRAAFNCPVEHGTTRHTPSPIQEVAFTVSERQGPAKFTAKARKSVTKKKKTKERGTLKQHFFVGGLVHTIQRRFVRCPMAPQRRRSKPPAPLYTNRSSNSRVFR